MTKASDNLFPKVILNEAATDGSDFSNPSADYRVLFLGEDGALHLKDSAGAVTAIGGSSIADILDLPTAETDDTLVLAPDGAGGVEFRAESTGSGLSVPSVVSAQEGNAGNSLGGSITLDVAPASGHSLIVSISDSGGTGPSSLSSTNTTWTKLAGPTQNFSLWVGVVAGGTGGTTVTVAGLGTYSYATIIEITDTLAPTLTVGGITDVASASLRFSRLTGLTAGRLVVFALAARGTTGGVFTVSDVTPPAFGPTIARSPLLVGYATHSVAVVASLVNPAWFPYFLGEIT